MRPRWLDLPALIALLFLFTKSYGTVVSTPFFPIVVTGAVAVRPLPLSILFAVILRIATVSQQTAAVLPSTTPSQER